MGADDPLNLEILGKFINPTEIDIKRSMYKKLK